MRLGDLEVRRRQQVRASLSRNQGSETVLRAGPGLSKGHARHNVCVPPTNNPATRLATILTNLRGQLPGTTPTRQALMNVLGCTDEATFFPAYGRLLQLPAQIDTAVKEHVDLEHHDLADLMVWQPHVQAAFLQTLSLTGRIDAVLQHYDDNDIRALRICGSLLSASGAAELPVDPAVLEELRQRVQELHDDVLETPEVPEDLKRFILNQLDEIRKALREFQISGTAAIEEVLERVTGAVVVNRDLLTDDNEKSQSFIQRLGEILGLVEKASKATDATTKAIATVLLTLGITAPPAQLSLPAPPTTSASQPAEHTNGIPGGPLHTQEPR